MTAPTTRSLLRVAGGDAHGFLQGLVTNDVAKATGAQAIYAALLTPQGKYIADFLIFADGADLMLDVHGALAAPLLQRLQMYRLRSDVTITPEPRHLHRGLGPVPDDGFADPRHPDMGWRAWRDTPQPDSAEDWTARRVALGIPEAGAELTSDSFILEMRFEALNGVDFRKGCYVGQEVTARMKHKTQLRKGLARVHVDGPADPGTQITGPDGRPAGTLHSRSGDEALAYLRFDRAEGQMQAGAATVTRIS